MRLRYSQRKMAKPYANSGDPDQTPCFAVSDLGLHCLPNTLLGDSRLQWVKGKAHLNIYIHLNLTELHVANQIVW